MKKMLLGIALFVAVAYFPLTASAQEYQWGSWSTDPCFSGVQFRARYDYYNEIAKKHHWSIQYKNNYTRDIAFSYNIGSSREGILKDVREKRGMYRTRIKPGQIDSGMWVFTDSQGQILETMGHARLLGSDEVDYKGPFMTCDSGGNRGQIDTICRNEPNPYIGCQNRPSPPPAAMTFPNKPWRNPASGKTTAASPPPASPSDCLDLYKYFSENKKSDDPLAVKQSIDAANAFKARCKLSPEQQSSLNDSITSAGNHLERVQSNALSAPNGVSGGNLVTTIDAVKKGPKTDEIYARIIENLRANLLYYSGPLKAENGRLILNEGSMICSGAFEKLEFSNYRDSMTPHIAIDNIACPGGYNGDTRAVVRYNSGPNDLYIQQLNDLVASLKNQPANGSEDEAIDTSTLTKPQPVPEAEYAKKVVAEAKAKGIKIEPDSTNQKPKPRPVPPPRQRAAQNAEASQELVALIESDIEKKKAEDEVEQRRRAEDERKKAEAGQRDEAIRRRKASVVNYGKYGCKGDVEFCTGKLPYTNKQELMGYIAGYMKRTLLPPRYFSGFSGGGFRYNKSWSEREEVRNIWVGKVKETAFYECEFTISLNRVSSVSGFTMYGGSNIVSRRCTRNNKPFYNTDDSGDAEFELNDGESSSVESLSQQEQENLRRALEDLGGN